MPPHPNSWRSILLLFTNLRLSLPSGLFPSGFLNKSLYTSLLFPIHATGLTYPISFDLITTIIFDEEYKSLSFSLLDFLISSVTSSLLGPNILISNLFSNAQSLCSLLSLSDRVSHPYTTGTITFHHGKARPQFADGGTASSMEVSCEYIKYDITDSRQGMVLQCGGFARCLQLLTVSTVLVTKWMYVNWAWTENFQAQLHI